MLVADPDVPESWLPPLAQRVEIYAAQLRGSTEFTSDLRAGDDWIAPLLEGRLLRAYHCTRLLDHEVEAIRSEGLRLLTHQLVSDRIAGAYARGLISARDRDLLSTNHVFARNDAHRRSDQICLALSKRTFECQAFGVEPLLSYWGGEAMRGPDTRDLLASLGRPAVVVALLDLTAPGEHMFFPSLENVFVGSALGLDDVSADVFYLSPISGRSIEAVWQPGCPDYDAFTELPRC